MGRRTAMQLRQLAAARGWLDPAAPVPDDEAIAMSLKPARRARSTVSHAEPRRTVVERWVDQNVGAVAIHAALRREHGFSGSYSSIRRMVARVRALQPPDVTVRLEFAPGEAAQVDFGAGPFMIDPNGQRRRAWCFVMTLSFPGISTSSLSSISPLPPGPAAIAAPSSGSSASPHASSSTTPSAPSGSRPTDRVHQLP